MMKAVQKFCPIYTLCVGNAFGEAALLLSAGSPVGGSGRAAVAAVARGGATAVLGGGARANVAVRGNDGVLLGWGVLRGKDREWGARVLAGAGAGTSGVEP